MSSALDGLGSERARLSASRSAASGRCDDIDAWPWHPFCLISWSRTSPASAASVEATASACASQAVIGEVADAENNGEDERAHPTVVMRKARPRICSRYSRLAIRSMLRIGLASDGLNEDLFERRLDQFESIDRGGGRSFVQQLLRDRHGA